MVSLGTILMQISLEKPFLTRSLKPVVSIPLQSLQDCEMKLA